MSRELRLRIISGLILAVIVLAATWAGGLWFRCLSALILVLIYFEFSTIAGLQRKAQTAAAIGWVTSFATAISILLSESGLAVATILVGAAGAFIAGRGRSVGPWAWISVLYAGFSGLALAEIRGETVIGLVAVLFLFAVVWATDILAYFCGRAIGGRKLAPAISPGKTWSGALFGTAAGVAAGVAMIFAMRGAGGMLIPFLAFVLSVVSQAGDLFESHVKRRFGVKDSSKLIPGHGGVMDRVDGLVFAAFAAFLMATVLPSPVTTGADELAARLLGY